MKILILITTFAVTIASTHSLPEFVDGSPILARSLLSAGDDANEIEPSACTEIGLVCPTKCHSKTLWYCANIGAAPAAKIPCPDEAPKCNGQVQGKASCSANEADSCNPLNDFTCPNKGQKYPDLTNCRKYYVCGDGEKGVPLECPAQYVYNHAAGKCQRQKVQADCVTLDCSKTTALVLPYPPDQSIYGICIGKSIHLAQCPAAEKHDGTQCTFVCTAEGEFPKSDTCSQDYYICYKNGSKFNKLDQKCPSTTYFNSTTGSCELGGCGSPTDAGSPSTPILEKS